MSSEPKLETHEDAVNLVKTVFEQMGGTVLPPRRPYRTQICTEVVHTIDRDDFLMDLENEILREWDARKDIPTGPRRYENAEWAELVKRNVYPHHSDVDWHEYVEWVSRGGGDEWFQEE